MRTSRPFFAVSAGSVAAIGLLVALGLAKLNASSARRKSPPADHSIESPRAVPFQDRQFSEMSGQPVAVESQRTTIAEETPAAGPPVTAEQEREKVVARLQTSGTSTAPWTGEASTLFKQMEVTLDADGRSSRGNVECYNEGCIQQITFKSFADVERDYQTLRKQDAWGPWPGSKMRTGPEMLPNGEVRLFLVLFHPDPR